MHSIEIDKIDLAILKLLQTHGRLSNQELAELVGLSPSPCSRRVKALEATGFISGYATLLSARHFDLRLTAFVQVQLEKQMHNVLNDFEEKVATYDEVQECYLLTGSDADYQLKVLVEDMDAYREFILDRLLSLPFISGIKSSFVLKAVKNNTQIPLPDK
ncbi:AsnC family transcriptional regulator [Psychromonas sp. CNPT3]|uniref:Lrp/AsnC family transcriptional regulator n=1 Tax=Psychromonas sp. CNPT3 TaxID=314282 RepID=UPI0002C09779|nr:Lrp/AsnC family transcriptional regulator [Psychromonas sp. CNPT3]AGH82268.1 AsnC family transcriptional regulator [Psychromonas sp. CNPT3]